LSKDNDAKPTGLKGISKGGWVAKGMRDTILISSSSKLQVTANVMKREGY
jgi:hypothetical protein